MTHVPEPFLTGQDPIFSPPKKRMERIGSAPFLKVKHYPLHHPAHAAHITHSSPGHGGR